MAYRPYGPWYGPRSRTTVDPNLRVSDAERTQVCEALTQHYTDGRLDATEIKERIDQAMGAKTRSDLSGLLTDLPPLAPPAPHPPTRRRRVGLWLCLALFVVVVSVPWNHIGFGPWYPHIPWLLIGVIAFIAWRSGRRHRHHHQLPS